MYYGYQFWSKEALMQAENDDDLDGGQRSSEVKWGKLCAMATIIWSKEALMQAENDDDLDGGQMSSEVKWSKLCAMATIIWSKEALMQAKNDDDLDGGQRSSEVKWGKLSAMATIFGQKKRWCKLRMMMTLMEVKCHQRSNGVNYVLWLPYLVKRSADASWEWWWPWWRSKVIRGQMW